MTTIKHYGAHWCVPCKTLAPMMKEIVSQNPSVQYRYIDVDHEPAEAQSVGIRSVPVVIIEKNGTETNRFIGLQSRAVYEQAIK